MSLKGIYKQDVVTCQKGASVIEVAKLMKQNQIGDVVIVEGRDGARKPIGLVTDRDIVLGAVSERSDDIKSLKVQELMSPDLITIRDDMWLFDALKKMRDGGVSRAPVVDSKGQLCGILSASSIFRVLNEEMTELSELTDRRKEFPQQSMNQGRQDRSGAQLQ